MILKRGDLIKITTDDRTVDGVVLFASSNGKSLMLSFEALLGGHVGMMPVLQDDDGTYRALITGEAIGILLVS